MSQPQKPQKPTPDFPLFAHNSGTWAKKIAGKHRHFGRWDDPDGALARYQSEYGLTNELPIQQPPTRVTVGEVVNRYLTVCLKRVHNEELSPVTFAGYHRTCTRFAKIVGKSRTVDSLSPDDFRAYLDKLRAQGRRTGIAADINHLRVAFNFAVAEELIPKLPRYGLAMKLPSKRELRARRNAAGPKLFEAEQIRKMLELANKPLKAMILLGLNCGLGNSDISRLNFEHLDLERQWLNYPRPKTGEKRECWLWPETVKAIREAIAVRRKPKSKADEKAVFITLRGRQRWVRFKLTPGNEHQFVVEDSVHMEFRKLVNKAGVPKRRCGFYWLRHGTETIGGDAIDQVAVDRIMGHVDPSIASDYRERINPDRIRAVAEHIRKWLTENDKYVL